MKPCPYCGRLNEDSAVRCTECGTSLNDPDDAHGPKRKSLLCIPGGWVCLVAGVVILQGLIRLDFTPYDPNLGEGDYKSVEAAFYFWLSLGIGLVLFGYGFYLLKKGTDAHTG